MSKGVKKVRKSIEQRKKMRRFSQESKMKQVYPVIPQEEEKHGYYPYFSDSDVTYQKKSGYVTSFVLKGILSAMLFFGTAILYETGPNQFQAQKTWATNILKEEFPFAKVNLWYRETFGTPLSYSPNSSMKNEYTDVLALPVGGNITETFQVNGKGIMITPEETAEVSVIREGVVIFAGNDRDTNKTVTVQHTDGTTSSYGHLSSIDVHLYQYVTQNHTIGTFTPTESNEMVYFSIEKENEYIDPVQVIKVDDLP